MAVKSIGAGFVPRNQPAPIEEDDRMPIRELAELAADILADVNSLYDGIAELENDGMETPRGR